MPAGKINAIKYVQLFNDQDLLDMTRSSPMRIADQVHDWLEHP
jgi:hypothetical protein